jgi:hypothetical protein
MERDSHELLLTQMELHYINMTAFVKHFEEMGATGSDYNNFTKWLMFITHKDIENKEAVRKTCEGDAEMKEAFATLRILGGNEYKREAYYRRLDEKRSYEEVLRRKDAAIADKDAALADKDAALADQAAALADKDAALVNQAAALADKDALIAELMAKLNKSE